MRTDIKSRKLFAPKWWNPLFWIVVILAPVLGIAAGVVAGALAGLLIGYEKGLGLASQKLNRFIATLP